MEASFVLVLSAILATALGGPISGRYGDDSTSCARTCTDTSKFNYAPGTTYGFEYNVQTQTAMEGTPSERAALGIQATANIEVLSKCDLALRLQDVKVYRSDPSSSTPLKFADETGEFKRNLERYPLRFSFQDGVVEELCPSDGESTWALNIKRGVLTSIQNSMDHLDRDQRIKESDIAGNCYTDYKVTNAGWYSTSIKKVKDILGCTDRHGYQSSIHATPYRVASDIQSLPLMKSTHENEQEVDKNGLLKSALIRETHTFRPFSQSSNGATTKIIQRLNYKTQRSGVTVRPDMIRTRTGLTYEHVYGNGERAEPRKDAEMKLEEICRDTREDIRPDTPRLFSELVYIIKNMDITALRDVYNQLKRGSLCSANNERTKKFFIDAIPMASTSAAVQFLTELLNSNDVIGTQADMWITSLALIHYPTLEMIEQVKNLVESPRLLLKAMLPVSTMINNYCSHNPSCADEYAIISIIAVFEKNIGYGCYVRDNKLETILMTLRALGNAGHVGRIVDSIRNCFTREGNPMEVRVAAIEAFRRLPCTSDRNELMGIYRNHDEDSEIRIAAYLALMECPDEDGLSRIQQTLESESANQVGSFVWSHLTNLMESSSPQKEGIRRILDNASLKREFDLEKLKYSRNYEGSLLLEKFNTGAMVDSNLIFSEKSFIPRSAMANLTVDLFGNSINLLEIGGRIEGLEYLLETYLGPYGYFGDKNSKKTIEQSKANLDKLRGSLYMRMFGNEMMFKHFKGMESLSSPTSFNYLEFLIKMSKKHDYSFTQSVMILDSSMIIPTSSGLPLNLTVNGTATIAFEASGQVDLRKAATKPRSLLIDGIIKPSGAIQIAGTMSMDAFVTKSGLRVVNTWHSSTALKGKIELTRGKILSAEIDLPQKKMEIIDVKTSFFSIHGDLHKEEDLITDNRKTLKMCTGDRIAKVTGIEICNEFQWPNASIKSDAPYFPFTGPFSYSMTLLKRDTHSGYKLLAKRSENKASSTAQLSFDTPGSTINRALVFDMSLNYKNKDVEVVVVSPWKKATAKGTLNNEKNLLGVDGKLMVDDRHEYGFVGQVKIARAKDAITYKPHLEIRRPGAKEIRLSGSVNTQGKKRANIDLSLNGITSKPIIVKATAQNTKIEKSIKAGLNFGPKDDYNIDASLINRDIGKKNPIIKVVPKLIISTPKYDLIKFSGNSIFKPEKSLDGDISLSVYKVLPKPLTSDWKFAVQTGGKGTQYSGTVKVRSKFLNTRMTGAIERKKKNTITSKLSIDYSIPVIKSIRPNKFEVSSKFTDRSTKSTMKYFLNANFIAKRNQDWNFATSFDLIHNRKQSGTSLELKYGKNQKDPSKQITASADINHEIGAKTAVVKYDIAAKFPPKDVNIRLKGKHKHDKRNMDSGFKLDYGKGKAINANLNLKDSSKKSTKMSGSFSLSSPFKNINLKTDLTQSRKDYVHQVTLKLDKDKSTVVTTYRKQKGTIHSVDSDISLHFMKPLTVKGEVDLDFKDFKISGTVDHSGRVYSVGTAYKFTRDPKGKWSLDLACPARHVIIEVEGGMKSSIYSGSVDMKWDADRDVSKKLTFNTATNFKSLRDIESSSSLKYPSRVLKLNVRHQGGNQYSSHADFSWSSKKQVSLDATFSHNRKVTGTLRLQTPFRKFEEMSAEVNTDNNREKYMTKAQVTWGKQRDAITGSITLKKPYSVKNLDFSVTATSPFKGYRRMSAELTENVDSKRINANIKGALEDTNVELTISAINKGDYTKRNVEGSMVLNSNIPKMKVISVEVNHNDDNRKFVTDVVADINGDRYMYDLDMTHALAGWQYENDGTLTLSLPRFRMKNNWSHRNAGKDLKTTITSEWGREKKIHFNLVGNHDSSSRTTTTGGLTLQTPWDPVRDIDLSLNNVFGRGFIRSTGHFKKDRSVLASSQLNYRRSVGMVEADFIITTPYTVDDLKGKVNSRYNIYPMTGHAEFEWSPYEKVSADGSVNLQSIENLEGELRVTTPYRNFRNIVVKASNKYENNEWLSSALLDYAPRKSIELESHVTTGVLKKARVTLKTPFDDLKMIDTGAEFSGGFRVFNSRGDFAFYPHVGKYAGMMNWNYANNDISGKLRVDTPLADYRYMQAILSSQRVDNGKRHSRIEAQYHPREMMSLDVTYKIDMPFILDAEIQTPFKDAEHLALSVKHSLRRRVIQSSAEITYAPYKTIASSLSLRWNNDIDGNLVIMTPFLGYEKSKLSFRHEGELTDFKCHGEVEFARRQGEADLQFEHGPQTRGTFTMTTPFSGFESTKAVISRKGGIKNLKSDASLTYGDGQEIKVTFNNNLSPRRLDSLISIQSPFLSDIKLTVDHDGNLRSFTTKVGGSYGREHSFSTQTGFTLREPTVDFNTNLVMNCVNGNKNMGITFHKDGPMENMNAKLTGEYNSKRIDVTAAMKRIGGIEGTLTVTTPFDNFRDLGITMKHTGDLNAFNSEGGVKYMDGKTIEGNLAFSQNGIRMIDTNGELKTPFDGFRSTSVSYHHTLTSTALRSNGQINYGYNKRLSSDISATISPKITLNAEIGTPFEPFEITKAVITHEGPLENCKSHAEFEMAGKTITADSEFMHGQSTNANMVVSSNIAGMEHLNIKASREGTIRNLRASAEVTLRNSTFDVSLNNRFTGKRLVTAFVLKNSYTEDITFNIDHNGRLPNFNTQVSANMGPDTGITVDMNFVLNDLTLKTDCGVEYKFAGSGNKYMIKLGKDGPVERMSAYLTTTCGDKAIDIKGAFRNAGQIHGEITATTPYDSFRNLALTVDHSGEWNRFTSEGSIRYMDGQEITGKIIHFHSQLRRIESSIEMNTPFQGFEFTKMEYRHRGDSNSFKCNANAQYGAGQKLSGELSASISPKYEFQLKTNTPFSGYRQMTASGSFESSEKKYVLSSEVSAGRRKKISFDSTVDLTASPMSARVQLKSPFVNFEDNEIIITHDGSLKNFRTTVDVKSPLIDSVSGEASLHYRNPFEMNAIISLSNAMKLSVENTVRNERRRSHIEAAWAPRKQIILEGSYLITDSYYEKSLSADASISTPFNVVQQAELKIDHSRGNNKATQKVEVEFNGKSILDMDIEYNKEPKHESIITFRKPRPMQYTLSGEIGDNNVGTELFVNWDRDEPESNVRFQTSLMDRSDSITIDKDIKIKLIHPARTLGVVGSIAKSGAQTKSVGQLIWNEDAGQMFSYDFDLTDKSRRYSTMYDGSLKLGTPVRGFQVDGSFSDARGSKTIDGSFLWDANKDQTKQVGLKAVLSPSAVGKKAEVSLRLPSIGKDIKLDTEVTVNDGRTLFDGKTEFSYSADTRKTVTLTSKVEDISYGYYNKNYSMTMGLSHPYTDVHVGVRSNIGKSNEKYTGAMDVLYLTARRERKNFALRGEINRIRNEMNLQMVSPIKTITVSGDIGITNPYSLRLRNAYDDNRVINSEVTIDTEKRSINFQTNYDLDQPGNTLHMQASYINSSAVKAELYRATNYRRMTDSVIAMRLNTSRILHTRISWRPEVVQELQEFLTSKIQSYGRKTNGAFHEIYESVGQELSGKYRRISAAASEELAPFISLIESEMTSIEKQLDDIRRDIRRMYRRNDLYIADMGVTFVSAFEKYKDFVSETKAKFDEISQSMSGYLEGMTQYPIREEYQEMVAETLYGLKNAIDRGVRAAVDIVAKIDDQLKGIKEEYQNQVQKMKDRISDTMDSISNHPQIVAVKSKLSDIDYQQYITTVQDKVKSMNIPEKYNSIIYNAREMINTNLANILEHEDIKHMRSLANDAYQEGVWAYNYWQVEENLKKHLKSIYEILKELVEEEIQSYREQLVFLEKSKFTVWDPEHGEIQMELYLPIPLKSLDSIPEVDTTYVETVKNTVNKYIPDKITIQQYYEKYVPSFNWRSANATKPASGELQRELNEYMQQSPRTHRPRRRYRARSI